MKYLSLIKSCEDAIDFGSGRGRALPETTLLEETAPP